MKTTLLEPEHKSNATKIWLTYSLNDEFIPGVVALGQSLRFVSSAYPLWCMVGPDVGELNVKRLQDIGVWVVLLDEEDIIHKPGSYIGRYKDTPEKTLTKLNYFRLWNLEKLVYLDADTVFLRNSDELFESPSIGMVPLLPKRSSIDTFSAGVIVLAPKKDFCFRVAQYLSEHEELTGNRDQTLVNKIFQKEIVPLPRKYNFHYKDLVPKYIRPTFIVRLRVFLFFKLAKAKILHFDGQKPWNDTTDSKMKWTHQSNSAFRFWWELYDSTQGY